MIYIFTILMILIFVAVVLITATVRFQYTPELSKTITLSGTIKDIVIDGKGTKKERLEYLELESQNGLTHFVTFDEIKGLDI